MDDMLTLVEAAEYLGINRETVRIWAKQGKLKGRFHLGSRQKGWRVSRSELDRLLAGEAAEGEKVAT